MSICSPPSSQFQLGRALSGPMNTEQVSTLLLRPGMHSRAQTIRPRSAPPTSPGWPLALEAQTPRRSPGRGWHRRACRGRWARAWEHHGARWRASGRKATRHPVRPSEEPARPSAAPLRSASLSASLPKRSSISAMAARSAALAWTSRAYFTAGGQPNTTVS